MLACEGHLSDPPLQPPLECTGTDEKCAEVDFERDIQPILSESCVRCHGGVRELGNLNLQTREAASRVLGHAEGDASLAPIFARIASTSAGSRMPLGAAPLTDAQVEKFRRWVQAGAPWPTHWSYRPVVKPDPETFSVSKPSWVSSPIDRFVLHRLDQAELAPASDAPPAVLVRRVSLDLTGLPPTPEDVDTFSRDPSEAAWAALVDRLLASPAFGERWGRHWLDQARYSDSDGYEKDLPRFNAWLYRDWVVDAFNADMPFDQFTVEQIAGDLLPSSSPSAKLATAFHRQTLVNTEGGVDPEEDRVKRTVDRTATVANTWLGLTLQCTQCHGHPYDRVSQKEFYELYAFFDRSEEGSLNLPTKGEGDTTELAADVLQQRTDSVSTMLLVRGDFMTPDRDLGALAPRAPGSIFPFLARNGSSRLDLARWLTDPAHPLTPRVLVNTLWYHLFGRGIVASISDFGTRGDLPSHPELLDWLAADFVENGFRQKRVIRQMVLSHTYRQSSVARPQNGDRDLDNALLSRQARVRVDAEVLRDGTLAASGLLSPKRGGPCVFPPLAEEMRSVVRGPYSNFEWIDSVGEDRYRRSLYTFHKRSAQHPTLQVFDWPTASASINARDRSTSPLQALTTLHDVTFVEAARAMAARVRRERPDDLSQQLTRAFRLALAREPSAEELAELSSLRSTQLATYSAKPQSATAALGETESSPDAAERAALVSVMRVILNLEEFMMRE